MNQKLVNGFEYYYQNQNYKSGMIFDYWSCGPATKGPNGEKQPGAFPAGFLKKLKAAFYDVYPFKKDEIAHVCSGWVPKTEGITIDIKPDYNPDIVSNVEDFSNIFRAAYGTVKWSIADPPYNLRRAKEYYNLQVLVNKSKMLHEMNAITEVGGFIGILDQYSLNGYPHNLKKIAVIAVASIPNPDLRVFTIWRKIGSVQTKLS